MGVEERLASELRVEGCVASFFENHSEQKISEISPLTRVLYVTCVIYYVLTTK